MYFNTTELNNLNINEAGQQETGDHTVCLKNNFSNAHQQFQPVQLW